MLGLKPAYQPGADDADADPVLVDHGTLQAQGPEVVAVAAGPRTRRRDSHRHRRPPRRAAPRPSFRIAVLEVHVPDAVPKASQTIERVSAAVAVVPRVQT